MAKLRFSYRWKNTYPQGQPSPGSEAQAFQAFQEYPVFPYYGRGIPVRWTFSPHQPPQIYAILAIQTSSVAGAGIPAGQIFTSQLLDPNAPPYPAYES